MVSTNKPFSFIYLKEVFLLRVFFECHEELSGVRLFRVDEVAEALEDEDRRQLIVRRVLADRVHAHRHEVPRLLLSPRRHILKQLQKLLLGLVNKLRALHNQSPGISEYGAAVTHQTKITTVQVETKLLTYQYTSIKLLTKIHY